MNVGCHHYADHRHPGDDDQYDEMYTSFSTLLSWLRIIVVSKFRVDEIRERRSNLTNNAN